MPTIPWQCAYCATHNSTPECRMCGRKRLISDPAPLSQPKSGPFTPSLPEIDLNPLNFELTPQQEVELEGMLRDAENTWSETHDKDRLREDFQKIMRWVVKIAAKRAVEETVTQLMKGILVDALETGEKDG